MLKKQTQVLKTFDIQSALSGLRKVSATGKPYKNDQKWFLFHL